MPYVTLIPGLLCILVLLRGGTRSAFLNVFLPTLLLLPANFYLQITHLPNLTFVDIVLCVLGAGILFLDMSRWKFSPMDVCVVVFIFSCGYSEWVHYAAWRAGALAVMEGLVPYMAAKLLMREAGMGMETMKRMALLTAAASVIGMYEFVLKRNPYNYFWSHFYPGQWGYATTQIRWGFGRVSGPYMQSEFAGIVLLAALLFEMWLARWYAKGSRFRSANERPLKFARILLLVLAVSLFTTQARGPWIGALVAVAVAYIGLARKPLRRGIFILSFLVLIGIPTYEIGKDYLAGPRTDYGSEKETAQYRAELIDNYIPLAESGGAWGLGRMMPIVKGQTSIDNEYLFVWLVQGYIGLTALVLIIGGSAFSFARVGITTDSPRERHLAFTLLGVLMGVAFTVTTVWLGVQSFELFFLLVGWSQVVEKRPVLQQIEHRQEFIRVYT